MDTGLNIDFKDWRISTRPAYPGFMVRKNAQFLLISTFLSSTMIRFVSALTLLWTYAISCVNRTIIDCCIRLNSSKTTHEPDDTIPLKNFNIS
jgi:hypothetical protein